MHQHHHQHAAPAHRSASPFLSRVIHDRRPEDPRSRPAESAGSPDFAALFAIRDPAGRGEDRREPGWQLTPRTAHLLHTVLVVLADEAYDDAQHLGDRFLPEVGPATLEVFDRLPAYTWTADHRWRQRMARAFGDLACDLADGLWPNPGCAVEEMALDLALEDAPVHLEGLREEDDHHALPEHEDDYRYSRLLFRHREVPMPCLAECTGGEHLGHPANRSAGAGGLGQAAWLAPFDGRSTRDLRAGRSRRGAQSRTSARLSY